MTAPSEVDRGIFASGGRWKTPGKCKFCEQPATHRVVWAEGMAAVPVDERHIGKAKDTVGRDEVSAVHKFIGDGQWKAVTASALFAEVSPGHEECREGEFCVATHKPGVCKGTKRGSSSTSTWTPPKPIERPQLTQVTTPTAARTPEQVAADNEQNRRYQAAMAHAAQLAQQLGGGRSVGQARHSITRYGQALHAHNQATAAVDRAHVQSQAAHDREVAINSQREATYQQRVKARADAIDAHNRATAARQHATKTKTAHDRAYQALVSKLAAIRAAAHTKKGGTVASSGLAVFDLYAAPVTAGDWLYGQVDPSHYWCEIGTFCRNPLHPGPCKGWKHTLHSVAPGAYHAYEKARVAKLNEKRKAKIKALQDAGHPVPKSLLKEITYDPSKLKPQEGYTPPTPKEAEAKLPATAKEIAEKIAQKHADTAGAKKVGAAHDTLTSLAEKLGKPLDSDQQDNLKSHLAKAVAEQGAGGNLSEHPGAQALTKEIIGKSAPKGLHPATKKKIEKDTLAHLDTGAGGVPDSVQKSIDKAAGKAQAAKETDAKIKAQGLATHAIADLLGGQKSQDDMLAAVKKAATTQGKLGQPLVDAPIISKTIDHMAKLAAQEMKDHGLTMEGGKEPNMVPIAEEMADHIEQGKPGLPPSLQALKDAKTGGNLSTSEKQGKAISSIAAALGSNVNEQQAAAKMKEHGPDHPDMDKLTKAMATMTVAQAGQHGVPFGNLSTVQDEIKQHIAEGKPGLPKIVQDVKDAKEGNYTPPKPGGEGLASDEAVKALADKITPASKAASANDSNSALVQLKSATKEQFDALSIDQKTKIVKHLQAVIKNGSPSQKESAVEISGKLGLSTPEGTAPGDNPPHVQQAINLVDPHSTAGTYKKVHALGLVKPEDYKALSDADKAKISDAYKELVKDGTWGPVAEQNAKKLGIDVHGGGPAGAAKSGAEEKFPTAHPDVMAAYDIAKDLNKSKGTPTPLFTALKKGGVTKEEYHKLAPTAQKQIAQALAAHESAAPATAQDLAHKLGIDLHEHQAASTGTVLPGDKVINSAKILKSEGKTVSKTDAAAFLKQVEGLSDSDIFSMADDEHMLITAQLAKIANNHPEMHAQAKAAVDKIDKNADLSVGKSFDTLTMDIDKSAVKSAAPLGADVPAHVKAAQGYATGATSGIAKTKVAAYGKLTEAEFHSLPTHVQQAIVDDLKAAHAKFQDPAKKKGVEDILDKLGEVKAPTEEAPKHPTAIKPDAEKYYAAYKAAANIAGGKGEATKVADFEKAIKDGEHEKMLDAIAKGMAGLYVQTHGSAEKQKDIESGFRDMLHSGQKNPPVGSELEKLIETKSASYGGGGANGKGSAIPESGEHAAGTAVADIASDHTTIVQPHPDDLPGGYTVKQLIPAGHEKKIAAFNAAAEEAVHGDAAHKVAPLSITKLKNMHDKQLGPKTAAQVQHGFTAYSGSEYIPINGLLRHEAAGDPVDAHSEATYRPIIQAMDAGFEHSKLTKPVLVHRGVKNGMVTFGEAWDADKSMVGAEFSDPGYGSSSTSYSVARNFAGAGYNSGAVVMRIVMPKGFSTVSLKGGYHSGEDELLIPRGTKFRIVADNGWQAGARHLDVEIIE